MRRRPTDRPPVANLRVTDLSGGAGQQPQLVLQQVGELDVVVGGQCANRDMAVFLTDVAEVADAADVDQKGWCREPQLHQRDEAMPARENLRLLAVLDELRNRLRQGARPAVLERGWIPRLVPAYRCISCESFGALAG